MSNELHTPIQDQLSNWLYLIATISAYALIFSIVYLYLPLYEYSEEDIGYLAGTNHWDLKSWLLNGNRYYLLESDLPFYWRPASLTISYLFLQIFPIEGNAFLFANAVLHIFISISIARFVSLTTHCSPYSCLAFGAICVLCISGIVADSLYQYNWLQYNLSVALFFAGLCAYKSGSYRLTVCIFALAILVKDNAALILIGTSIWSIAEKNKRYLPYFALNTLLLLCYLALRVGIGSLNIDYLSHHTTPPKDWWQFISSAIYNVSHIQSDGMGFNPVLATTLNVCLFVILFSIPFINLKLYYKVKPLWLINICLIIICLAFVKTHWKTEIHILIAVLFLSLWKEYNQKALWGIMLFGYLTIHSTIRLIDFNQHTDPTPMDYTEGSETIIIAQLMQEFADRGVNHYQVLPAYTKASPSMLADLLGHDSSHAVGRRLECNNKNTIASIANVEYRNGTFVLSYKCNSTQKFMEFETALGSGVIIADPYSYSGYGIINDGENYQVLFANTSGSYLSDNRILITALSDDVCRKFNSAVVKAPDKVYRVMSPFSGAEITLDNCKLMFNIGGSGKLTINLMDKDENIIGNIGINRSILAHPL